MLDNFHKGNVTVVVSCKSISLHTSTDVYMKAVEREGETILYHMDGENQKKENYYAC